MRIQSVFDVGFLFSLLFAVTFCHATAADPKDVQLEVIGFGECADCAQTNIKPTQAFSGLRVTIDCKVANGEIKKRGSGELDKDGKFKISLSKDMVLSNGALKEECYAQLHSATSSLSSISAPCPNLHNLEASKIIFKSQTGEKQTFTTTGKLKFSPTTCVSATWWYHHPPLSLPKWSHPPLPKWSHPPLPKLPPIGHYFPFPPKYNPPVPVIEPPPVPIVEPPPVPIVEPPPVPVVKPPPVPIVEPPPVKPKPKPKPQPTPAPVPISKPKPEKKPCPPVYKPKPKPKPKPKKKTCPPVIKPIPKPSPVPVYHKPPTPVPVYHKPPAPVYVKPPTPVYVKPPTPIYVKPPTPIFKKPCPPIPKITLPPYKGFPPHPHPHPHPYFPPLPPHHP